MESGYYPPGAENDPNAPYNQVDPPPISIEVCVSQTLSKNCSINVVDYIYNDDKIDTSECCLEEDYKEEEFTIPELLDELKKYVLADLENAGEKRATKLRLKKLLKSCEGWVVDDFEIIQDFGI